MLTVSLRVVKRIYSNRGFDNSTHFLVAGGDSKSARERILRVSLLLVQFVIIDIKIWRGCGSTFIALYTC